jgi:DNA-directed RNA polymerase subunit alpha
VTRIRFTSAQAAGPEGGSVLHEFSAIEGVKEDVTDIILNIKDLVVRSDSDEPVEIFLGGDGPGVLTAENIFAPSQVEVVNEDLHIATLNANGHLEMYLTVERGRGYRTADANKRRTTRSASSRSTRSSARSVASPTGSSRPASSR